MSDTTNEDDHVRDAGESFDDNSWIARMKAKAEALALEAAGVAPEGPDDDEFEG